MPPHRASSGALGSLRSLSGRISRVASDAADLIGSQANTQLSWPARLAYIMLFVQSTIQLCAVLYLYWGSIVSHAASGSDSEDAATNNDPIAGRQSMFEDTIHRMIYRVLLAFFAMAPIIGMLVCVDGWSTNLQLTSRQASQAVYCTNYTIHLSITSGICGALSVGRTLPSVGIICWMLVYAFSALTIWGETRKFDRSIEQSSQSVGRSTVSQLVHVLFGLALVQLNVPGFVGGATNSEVAWDNGGIARTIFSTCFVGAAAAIACLTLVGCVISQVPPPRGHGVAGLSRFWRRVSIINALLLVAGAPIAFLWDMALFKSHGQDIFDSDKAFWAVARVPLFATVLQAAVVAVCESILALTRTAASEGDASLPAAENATTGGEDNGPDEKRRALEV